MSKFFFALLTSVFDRASTTTAFCGDKLILVNWMLAFRSCTQNYAHATLAFPLMRPGH